MDEVINYDKYLVGLPIGWNKNYWPDNREEFLEYDTAIRNLWDYTKPAHGGIEHWDNKIRSFFCSSGSNVSDKKHGC